MSHFSLLNIIQFHIVTYIVTVIAPTAPQYVNKFIQSVGLEIRNIANTCIDTGQARLFKTQLNFKLIIVKYRGPVFYHVVNMSP